jgi:hypothetical protein
MIKSQKEWRDIIWIGCGLGEGVVLVIEIMITFGLMTVSTLENFMMTKCTDQTVGIWVK